MNDFIQSLSFSPGRTPPLSQPAFPVWVQRGIMRSFGEDDGVAPYFLVARLPVREARKTKSRNRK